MQMKGTPTADRSEDRLPGRGKGGASLYINPDAHPNGRVYSAGGSHGAVTECLPAWAGAGAARSQRNQGAYRAGWNLAVGLTRSPSTTPAPPESMNRLLDGCSQRLHAALRIRQVLQNQPLTWKKHEALWKKSISYSHKLFCPCGNYLNHFVWPGSGATLAGGDESEGPGAEGGDR